MVEERRCALKAGLFHGLISFRLAAEHNYPSPIHDTLEDTHKNYNVNGMTFLLGKIFEGKNVGVIVASHNEQVLVALV